ncbi:hypothetical protein QJS10_CPB04g00731 [Acorus calamus]|uniref:SAGA-associated factor 11 n=1 Tax=Acorus calamus TaxID=4465 RepID=A0AAV9EWN0_ACOCL|nr:hypothetical protein QJS10_CPB04g00731 [Acorus calamus]
MVCSIGRERMADTVRLLASGNIPEITSEEATHEKLAVQFIHRELNDADEANLLDEEDMHVFDSRPLTDPLHLVCCNACKKPIKASQFAAHAERCRSYSTAEDIALENDGGTGHKKPPRKGRKKSQTAQDGQGTPIGEQERSESIDGDDVAVSESNVDEHVGMASSVAQEGHSERLVAGREEPCGNAPVGFQKSVRVVEHDSFANGCHPSGSPVPLASKIYYSLGNRRLRISLGHLYREASEKEHLDSVGPKILQGNSMMLPKVSSPNCMVGGANKVDMSKKEQNDACHLPSVRKPDQILAQSSELCLGASGGYPSAMGLQNPSRDSNFPKPADNGPAGMIRSTYPPGSYSFPGNQGTALGVMQ